MANIFDDTRSTLETENPFYISGIGTKPLNPDAVMAYEANFDANVDKSIKPFLINSGNLNQFLIDLLNIPMHEPYRIADFALKVKITYDVYSRFYTLNLPGLIRRVYENNSGIIDQLAGNALLNKSKPEFYQFCLDTIKPKHVRGFIKMFSNALKEK